MAINSVRQLVDAELSGRTRQYNFRKTPSQATTAGFWWDLSMSPGNPTPKYWFDAPPGIAQQITQSTDGGIFHGSAVTPYSMYLRELSVMNTVVTALPIRMLLCDYLLYYPSIDESNTDVQTLDNTSTLPRYTTGEGVFPVAISVAAGAGTGSFYINYTNSAGVAGRVSKTMVISSGAAIGNVKTSSTGFSTTPEASGPFIALQAGDKGVRSIESVVFTASDIGLISIILVKPLASALIREITAPCETDFFTSGATMPQIQDDAFLNFLMVPQGSVSTAVIIGSIKTVYN